MERKYSPPENESTQPDIRLENVDNPQDIEVVEKQAISQNYGDPFANEDGAEVKYKTMTWWQGGLTMIAEIIALGILSLPSVVAAIGLIGACFLIVGLGIVATYTGYVIGEFKLRYPQVYSMGDAGYILLGPWGREIFGAAQLLFLIFIMGSHVLTFSIMLNTLSEHGGCTIGFEVAGLFACFVFNIPRTLKNVSYLSIASFISIFSAVMITMIAIGVEHPGKIVQATVKTSFYQGFMAVTGIIFAYAGHVAFFSFISELKEPRDFPKALYVLQFADTSLYLIAAVVIYRYGGPDVTSPALGSTGTVMSKVAYGIAIPTIIIAGVINGHVATKQIYVRIFAGTDHMHKNTWLAIGSWIGIALGLWTIAWIIAEAIPVFNDLLSLIVSLFASWFTYGLSGVFWLFMHYGNWFSSKKQILFFCMNVFTFALGVTIVGFLALLLQIDQLLTFQCGLGLYVSGKAIHDNPSKLSYSCVNNA